MNEKEISAIRRRYSLEKNNITRIRGCYVNEKREIVSELNQSLALMSEDESEEILAVLKKTLSGTIDKNLIDIEFSNQQVLEGNEHKLLMTLRNSSLDDDNAVKEFYEHVINALTLEGNYLILLSYDKYDVPSYTKDEKKDDDSSTVFSYILCSICPLKMTKPVLSYYARENKFRNIVTDSVVSMPELGFMFPVFEDRTANIYNALYYSHNITDNHKEFVDAVFKSEIPMPAAAQMEIFKSILEDTISEDCSYEVMQAVHDQICGIVEEHKTNKEDPLIISKYTVKEVLESCGVSESHVAAFEEKYDTEFGVNTEINPNNIINTKQFNINTPDITIKVNPECSNLIETRIIDGKKYILICADENVEVNGVNINIM